MHVDVSEAGCVGLKASSVSVLVNITFFITSIVDMFPKHPFHNFIYHDAVGLLTYSTGISVSLQ